MQNRSESTWSKFLVKAHLLDLKKYLVPDFSLVLCHLLQLRRRKERNKKKSKKKSEKKEREEKKQQQQLQLKKTAEQKEDKSKEK